MTSVMISICLLSIFLFLACNIPVSPPYGVYVSQLIRYTRAFSEYRSFCTWENYLLINYWHRDIASQHSSKQLWSSMVAIMKLGTNLVFLCPKLSWTYLRPNSFKFDFTLPYCNIHVTGVSTEPGGAYSPGASGLASISEVHAFTQFCHITQFTVMEYRFGIVVL